jgi:hypothetical protein
MIFQVTATHGKQRIRFYVPAGGAKPLKTARDRALSELDEQLGLTLKDIEGIDIFQVEKVSSQGEDPKQTTLHDKPTRPVKGAKTLEHRPAAGAGAA